jgi:hypothetical protein
MTAIDGNILESVSATTLWTLHNRGTEAKRSDGVIRDPSHALRAVAFDAAASAYLTTHPRALPPGRGIWKLGGVATAGPRWVRPARPAQHHAAGIRLTGPPVRSLGGR